MGKEEKSPKSGKNPSAKKAKKIVEEEPADEEISSKSVVNAESDEGEDDEVLDVASEIEEEQNTITKVSFASLGIVPVLCEAIEQVGWMNPSQIQEQAIPECIAGRDVVGLAETGSGKTGAFAIPILQALLANPSRLFAVILAPTRELAFQINEVFEALGTSISLHSVCIVGGIDMMTQSIALAKKPHVIVATPGRLVDHLQNTKGFNLRTLKFLVMDEADRMLSMDFEEEINKILAVIPTERRTLLFSATMTSKVAKLQKASLVNPVKVEVSNKFQTPKQLIQQYLFIPAKWKDVYLAYTLDEFKGQTVIVFVATCNNALRITLMLRNLGFKASCLHGQLSQAKRLGALNKFKAGVRNILVATDVASRGLDIPNVDLVLNVDIPSNGKDYIHRVGRTARAGKAGRSIAYVTQYDVEPYQRLEIMLKTKLPEYPCDEDTVLILLERVSEAQRLAAREMRELNENDPKNKKRKKREEGFDASTAGSGSIQGAMHNQRGASKESGEKHRAKKAKDGR
jgi:ATP-dependent RNA helicase DDX47/RRP3